MGSGPNYDSRHLSLTERGQVKALGPRLEAVKFKSMLLLTR